jgi:aryl-alcohol dehydrogenase-like predicted oxidoreductase
MLAISGLTCIFFKVYSNGLSEVVLGKAIKQHNLPREEIVIMTKLYCAVGKKDDHIFVMGRVSDDLGYVNQHGLSRKVRLNEHRLSLDEKTNNVIAYLRWNQSEP